jgi:hypothetical protein
MQELSLHILDLVQNSLTAGATVVTVLVKEDLEQNRMRIVVKDNGCGMTPERCQAALDPFVTSRTSRKVGLGLPLFQAAAKQAGGWLQISSQVGKGTTVQVEFQHDHLDRAPLGDMAETLVSILALNADCRLIYQHTRGDREFRLDSEEIRGILGEVPPSHPEVVNWLLEYIRENEKLLEV